MYLWWVGKVCILNYCGSVPKENTPCHVPVGRPTTGVSSTFQMPEDAKTSNFIANFRYSAFQHIAFAMVRPKGSGGVRQLTEAEHVRIRTLFFDAGLSKAEIYSRLPQFSKAQIRKAIRQKELKRSPGRPRALSPEQEEELVEFVCASKKNRRMTFLELSVTLFSAIFGVWAIKKALYRLGFRRRIARQKPPLSEKNRRARLEWAREHINWTSEQWSRILWTDETWVKGGHHRRQYVTRRQGEEWDPTCIVERHQRKRGWMFWGCFHGSTKGPGLLWEKEWGKINQQSYCERIVPFIDGWIRFRRQNYGEHLNLMQDGAPGHAAADTKAELEARGVQVLSWPAYSPDLNPIEMCWNWM